MMKSMMQVMAAAAMFGCATYGVQAVLITSADGTVDIGFEAAEGYSTSVVGPNGGTGALQGQDDWVRHRVRGADHGTVDEDNQFRVVDSGGPGAFQGSQYIAADVSGQTRVDRWIGTHLQANMTADNPFIFRGAIAYGSTTMTASESLPIVGGIGWYLIGAGDTASGLGTNTKDGGGNPSGWKFGLGTTEAGLQAIVHSGSGNADWTAFGPVLDPQTWYVFEFINESSSVFSGHVLNVYDADGDLLGSSTAAAWRVQTGATSSSADVGWVGLSGLGGSSMGDATGWFDAIPEPASLALLGMGGLLMLRRSRD